jgi:hypothetical protein
MVAGFTYTAAPGSRTDRVLGADHSARAVCRKLCGASWSYFLNVKRVKSRRVLGPNRQGKRPHCMSSMVNMKATVFLCDHLLT